MTTTRLNDVDIDAVGALIGAIQEDPAKSGTKWNARVTWNGGFQSEVRVRDFDPVPSDEPPALGGKDTAANPVEQILGALGNCLAVGYAANATAAGIELKGLDIDLEGDLDLSTFLGLSEGHAGYEGVRARVRIDSDATAEQLDHLHNKVVSTSPVGHTLSRSIPLEVTLG